MASWRKNQMIGNGEVGHRRSSSYYRKPPSGNCNNNFSEKKFWAMVDSVPWAEGKRYIESHSKVMKWDDYAAKHAVYHAKFRFSSEINGYRCDIPLPDPDMYIDDVDWDARLDPELCLELDREDEARRNMIENIQETVVLGIEGIKPTGWEIDEEEVTRPQEPSYDADENNEANSWEENDCQRLIPKEHYVADFPNMYQARNDGYERRKNNMSWFKNHAYQHGNNDYKMNKGRRNGGRGGGRGGGGGKRGNYSYAAKVATPSS